MSEPRSGVEFSREFSLADLDDEIAFEVAAEDDERIALSRRFDLVALDSLSAAGTLKRLRDGVVRLRARLAAEVVQPCVVTLEPVVGRIDEAVEVLFAPPGAETVQGREIVVAVTPSDDCPEPLGGNTIDVGEVFAEHLGLALEPYPRQPGSVFEGTGTPVEQIVTESKGSPFEPLRNLKLKS